MTTLLVWGLVAWVALEIVHVTASGFLGYIRGLVDARTSRGTCGWSHRQLLKWYFVNRQK